MQDLKKIFFLGAGVCTKLISSLIVTRLCSEQLGPSAFGLTGQLNSLLAIVALVAGGGIAIGLNKIYAQNTNSVSDRQVWLRTSKKIVATSSIILVFLFFIFYEFILKNLFIQIQNFNIVFFSLLAAVFPIGYSAIYQGKINGYQRHDYYAASLFAGSILSVIGALGLIKILGNLGAFLSIIWIGCAQAFAMCISGMLLRDKATSISDSKNTKALDRIKFLLGFGALSISAGIILPAVYIFLRIILQNHATNEQFGLWQAATRISEAYTQIPLLYLSAVVFAKYAKETDRCRFSSAIRNDSIFLCTLTFLMCVVLYTSQKLWIPLIFTHNFLQMAELMPGQLSGDALRIAAYLGTTVMAAKGFVRICIAYEVLQGALLLCFSYVLIPIFSVKGAIYAYCLSYFIYLLLVIMAIFFLTTKIKSNFKA